jgi:hypothetical protein
VNNESYCTTIKITTSDPTEGFNNVRACGAGRATAGDGAF